MQLGAFTQPDEKNCFSISVMDNNDCNNYLYFTIEMSQQDPNDVDFTISIPVTTIVTDDSMEQGCSKYMY